MFSQQNPPSVQWQAIQTEHFEVVFPEEVQTRAVKVANELEHIYEPAASSLDTLPSKITVFLYNQSTISNGYVRLFPRFSAWYSSPNPDGSSLGNDEWLRSMGIHEYRHIVQFDKANQKFTKFVSRLLGDLARTGLAWSVPFWFVEGDAVVIETALTNEGRGRLPTFDMPIRANLLSDRKLSYEQAYLGSYKKYFPSFYHLGYHVVTYARRNHGKHVWAKITDKYSGYSFYPFAFSLAAKRITGHNIRGLYHASMDDLKELWLQKLRENQTNKAKTVSPYHKTWTNYTFPYWINDSSYIALRAGYRYANSLVKIDISGKEKYLCRLPSKQMHYAAGKVVWAEEKSDLRWAERSHRNIKIYDLTSGQTHSVTKKGKYFSPSLSTDGKKIVAVEFTTNMSSFLVVLETATGKVLLRKLIGDNETIRSPRWSEDDKKLVFTHSKYNGAALSVYNLETETQNIIIPHTWENITWPSFAGEYIIYNTNKSGINSVFAIDPSSKQQWQVVDGKFGTFNVNKQGNKILYQSYTADGHKVMTAAFEPQSWEAQTAVPYRGIDYYKALTEQEGKPVYNRPIQTREYEIEKFPWYKGLINFHSLMLYPSSTGTDALALSRNKLNTFDLEAGLGWDNNEQRLIYKTGATLKGLYPIISVNGEYSQREFTNKTEEGNLEKLKLHQTDLYAGVTLPFEFSEGEWFRNLSFGSRYQFTSFNGIGNEINTQRHTLGHSATFYSIRTGAYKDIGYRLGLSSFVFYKHGIDNIKDTYLFSTQNSVYLPGVFRHHSMKLEWAFEKKNQTGFSFSSVVPFARGYTSFLHSEMNRFSANYSFPVWYPDIRLGSLLYVNRLHSNLFYDNSQVNNMQLDSFGAELYFDFFVFQIKFPFTIGARYSHRMYDSKNRFEGIMVGVNFGFY